MRRIVASLLLIVACSGSTGGPTRSPPPAPTPPDAAPRSAAAPTEHECAELIAHAVELGVAAQRQARPADQIATDAEQAALQAELRREFLASCRAGTREGVRCGRAAATLPELAACYSTRSSSTSNSSVAPGGMTPPAPRSP